MVAGMLLDLLVEMTKAAEAVHILLKQIRIDRAYAQSQWADMRFDRLPVIYLIPGYVNGNTGANASDFVDLRRVCKLLTQATSRSWPVKDLERVPESP